MIRFIFLAALVAAALAATGAASRADDPPCRQEYVIPYSEQCNFSYKDVHKNTSPQNLSAAFAACDRAQNVALSCLKSSVHETHVIALSALYGSLSNQADIAMFAQQFRVAEALLREKLQVLDLVASEARPGDSSPANQRKATQTDLADALTGECTQKALASAAQQGPLGKAHKYGPLATLLKRKSGDYMSCAKAATTPAKKAYVEYLAFVALEESGRASQAAGNKDDATKSYGDCDAGAARSQQYAADRVKGYLATVGTLCRGRKDGKYRVDQPEPIDAADTNTFKPLTLPEK